MSTAWLIEVDDSDVSQLVPTTRLFSGLGKAASLRTNAQIDNRLNQVARSCLQFKLVLDRVIPTTTEPTLARTPGIVDRSSDPKHETVRLAWQIHEPLVLGL